MIKSKQTENTAQHAKHATEQTNYTKRSLFTSTALLTILKFEKGNKTTRRFNAGRRLTIKNNNVKLLEARLKKKKMKT